LSLQKISGLFAVAALFAGYSCCLRAQASDPQDTLLKKLNAQFVLTRMTADGSDVVKPGSAVTLHKDGLEMCSVEAKIPIANIYKDGKVSPGKFAWGLAMGMAQPNLPTSNIPLRTFVADEKFWVSTIDIERSYIVLKVYSDEYQNVRYYGQLAFQFNKKAGIDVDGMLKTIAEVVTAEPANGGGETTAASGDQVPPSQPTMAPLVPPPPPSDAPPPPPKTISMGQTKDQVVAALGAPQKIVQLGSKEIDYYPEMKVIFVDGKVSDVQ
jgi:hypothetical protein